MEEPHSLFPTSHEGNAGMFFDSGAPPEHLPNSAEPKRKPTQRGLPLPPLRLLALRLLICCFLVLVLFADMIAGWPIAQPSTAFALGFKNPNAALSAPSWLNQSSQPGKKPNLNKSAPATPSAQPSGYPQHAAPVPMKPARLTLSQTAQRFVSSDGQLEVDVSANSLEGSQLAGIRKWGGIHLVITQVKPASGSTASASGLISFGTYEFQFFYGSGEPLSGLTLLHPLTLLLHLDQAEQALLLHDQKVYTIWTAIQGSAHEPTISSASATTVQMAVAPQALVGSHPQLLYAQNNGNGRDWSIQSTFSASGTSGSSQTATPQAPATPQVTQASTVSFDTQADVATWGKPSDVQVGLNAGSLNYTYPLTIPAGPGGLTPPLSLTYSSASVDGNHDIQSAGSWVGQGWNMDLGSISWSEANVTPNGTATYENVWHINDANGVSGQLIPPDLAYTTHGTPNPTTSQLHSGTYVWHTAPESHAKVQEYSPDGTILCWRVWLPSGIMEEFGCTSDSSATYVDSTGTWDTYSWKLDMITDRYGNQIQVTYAVRNGSTAIRDFVPQDITYDASNCHSSTTRCTGSSWNPKVDIHFDVAETAANLLSGNCGSWSSNSTRCDDPQDLSGSGGLPGPKVVNEFLLNDMKVEVQGNLQHEYVFSYNQGGPTTEKDAETGKSISAAGYLTLGKLVEEGTNGTVLNAPTMTVSYVQKWEHYADLFSYSDNGVGDVCSPYSAAPRDGTSTAPCFVWAQTYNHYYISNLDNGRGWNESISWDEAHSNTWGTDNGTNYNNALRCTSAGGDAQTSTNVCGTADDKNWSQVVVTSRSAVSNGVTSTWSYSYYLTTVSASIPGHAPSRTCHGGCESYDWGNQNDDDYADYYNGDFQSFSKVQVSLPDGSSQTDTYGSTNGWGLYNSSITCYTGGTCVTAPFNGSGGPVYAGKQTKEQDYDSGGHLLKEIDWSLASNCPPSGVSGSQHASGGTSDPGSGQLFSELDKNNPLLVCDPRATQMDTYLTDGVTSTITDPRVVHETTKYTYDVNGGGGCSNNNNYDYGNLTAQDETANDVGGVHLVAETMFCPNDNLGSGIYLVSLPAKTWQQDQNSNEYGCHANFYGSNTGDLQAPSVPTLTKQEDHTPYNGTTSNCIGTINTTLHSYDAYGNAITNTDADNHLGCTSGSSQYSACATYDTTYETKLVKAVNAKNQATTYTYDSSAAGGYGQWLTAQTDSNGQTTTYQYDALGRLVGVVNPGDSTSSPTITYTYTNTCTAGSTTPCLELDTSARFTSGGPVSTEKQWYDGWGNLVETQVPSPNAADTIVTYNVYDSMNQLAVKSVSYAIATPAGYVAPDLTQARTVTSYDGLGRSLGSVTYSNATTIAQESSTSYTVAQGVTTLSSESGNAYEQTITLDAYHHQSITYTDGLGRTRYTQVFSGTASPYSVVRTVGDTYDMLGNTATVTTYDSTGTAKATSSATYDGVKELLGFNDSDQGSCTDTPMPADCSSTTDTAWKYTYDADSNQLSVTDPRNVSTYTTYDALNRPLCQALNAADASSCSGTTNAVYFYDSYNNSGTPGATFPSGCTAPSGSYASDPIGRETAELFIGASSAGSGWRCYGYDGRGRTDQSTLSVTTPDSHTLTQTVNLTYDDQSDVTSLVYPDGEVLTSNYDSNGRFQSAYFGTPSSPSPVQFLVGQTTYTNNGRIASLAMGGSASQTSTPTALFTVNLGYDSIQRVVSTSATEGSTTLFSQARTYDNDGDVLGLSTSTISQSGTAVSENEAFCYDALDRLVWAGNSGTPTGGDHCMSLPSNTGTTSYSQAYSYDSLDRLTSGAPGTYTYGDTNQVHAVTGLSSVPNQYAAYDAMGNMLCRNTDTATAHTCAGSSPTGATMTYDNEGRLSSWTAPSGTSSNETYLYDNSGNQVLTTSSQNGTPTDTIYFDDYTETVISGSTTTTTTYYGINGQRLAEKVGGTLFYLVSDLLSNVVMAVNNSGSATAVALYEPYGKANYSWGTMPTAHNYTGQRLDSQSGLLYYNFRWYDPVTGQFVRTDTEQNNANGFDPYAYVSDNPETKNDPTGHWGWGDIIAATVIAVVVAVVVVVAAPIVIAAVATAATAAAAGALTVAAAAAVEAVGTAVAAYTVASVGMQVANGLNDGGGNATNTGISAQSKSILQRLRSELMTGRNTPDYKYRKSAPEGQLGKATRSLSELYDSDGNLVATGMSDNIKSDPEGLFGMVRCSEGNCLINGRPLVKGQTYSLYTSQFDGLPACDKCQGNLQQAADEYGITINVYSIDADGNIPAPIVYAPGVSPVTLGNDLGAKEEELEQLIEDE